MGRLRKLVHAIRRRLPLYERVVELEQRLSRLEAQIGRPEEAPKMPMSDAEREYVLRWVSELAETTRQSLREHLQREVP